MLKQKPEYTVSSCLKLPFQYVLQVKHVGDKLKTVTFPIKAYLNKKKYILNHNL